MNVKNKSILLTVGICLCPAYLFDLVLWDDPHGVWWIKMPLAAICTLSVNYLIGKILTR